MPKPLDFTLPSDAVVCLVKDTGSKILIHTDTLKSLPFALKYDHPIRDDVLAEIIAAEIATLVAKRAILKMQASVR